MITRVDRKHLRVVREDESCKTFSVIDFFTRRKRTIDDRPKIGVIRRTARAMLLCDRCKKHILVGEAYESVLNSDAGNRSVVRNQHLNPNCDRASDHDEFPAA